MIADSLQRGAEGHLSELAVSAVADGQSGLLAPGTHAHLVGCDACQARLADAIVEFARLSPLVVAAPAPAKAPWAWIAAAAAALLAVRAEASLTLARDAQRLARSAALLGRSLLAQSSLEVGLVTVACAVALVVAIAKWVAPARNRIA